MTSKKMDLASWELAGPKVRENHPIGDPSHDAPPRSSAERAADAAAKKKRASKNLAKSKRPNSKTEKEARARGNRRARA
jgi:hypothetical protein